MQTKKKMEAAKLDDDVTYENGVPAGMVVDLPKEGEDKQEDEEDERSEAEEGEKPVRKQPKPKTKAQRAKAAKLLAEKRALAAAAARKKQLAIIEQAKGLRRATARQMTAQERAVEEKRLQMQLKLKQTGLAGQKLGKHKVPEAPVEVQIGEDLSENLRGLKVTSSGTGL
ncbi:hypothetical protein NMY22_g13121 [Coprinellus aureogranulatus]|nr:hypothetical protein NMY22_g13121 [Coprinellus aureogranulatus]